MINFGDCAINTPSYQSFTLTNHSESDVVRFTWDPPPQITFSPKIAHLLPNCAKDIKVTFLTAEPIKMESNVIACNIAKIQLAKKAAKVFASMFFVRLFSLAALYEVINALITYLMMYV